MTMTGDDYIFYIYNLVIVTLVRDVNDLIISLEKAKNDVFIPFLNVYRQVNIKWICLGFLIMNVMIVVFYNIFFSLGFDNMGHI